MTPDPDDIPRDLGPCCVCGKPQDGTVRTLVTLPYQAPRGTVGWGCVVCGLDMIGATAIVCDACVERHGEATEEAIRWVAAGRYASEGKRARVEDLWRTPHVHDVARHGEEG